MSVGLIIAILCRIDLNPALNQAFLVKFFYFLMRYTLSQHLMSALSVSVAFVSFAPSHFPLDGFEFIRKMALFVCLCVCVNVRVCSC